MQAVADMKISDHAQISSNITIIAPELVAA